MKILNLGDAFYVMEQIAYMSKSGDDSIKVFLAGNPAEFTTSFDSTEIRDSMFNEWRKAIVDYKKENFR